MGDVHTNVMEGYVAAAHVLSECRHYGGIVLRFKDGDKWRLHMLNGAAVPTRLKFRLLELEPWVMVLLRRLAAESAETTTPQR